MSVSNDKPNPIQILRDNVSFSSSDGRVQLNVTINKQQLNQLLNRATKAEFSMEDQLLGEIHQIDLIEPNIAQVTGTFRTDQSQIEANVEQVDDADAETEGDLGQPTITIDGREATGTLDIAFTASGGRPQVEIVDVNVPGLSLDSPAIQKINEKFEQEFVVELGESKDAGVQSIQVQNDALSVDVLTSISDRWLNTFRLGKFGLNIPSYSTSNGENYQWPVPWLPVVNVRSKPKGESTPRVAVGLVAVGDIAIGLVAAGGVAVGLLAVGGIAVGLLSLGGVALGWWLAAGGIGISNGISAAGVALSNWIGIGGIAVARNLTIGAIALTLDGYAFGAIAAARNALGAIAIGRVAFGVVAIGVHGWGIIPLTLDAWNAVKMFFGANPPS